MLGLVLADDLFTLYVFWEITSIASFLLVGQGGEKREERRAAVQALLVTVFGGLAMLLGFVLLGEAAGTYRISEILADPPRGGAVTAALLLILVGAFTKSAQLPFHTWLPAAMVAPTPVSAYLHAASMVKAGVYLVARLSPGLLRPGRVVGADRRRRPGHDARGRLAGAGRDRPQARARVRHRQPARFPHGPVRRWQPDRRRRGCRDAAGPRPVQGPAVPHRRHRRPRDRAPATCARSPGCAPRCPSPRSPPPSRWPRWPGSRRCSGSSARRPRSRRSSTRAARAAGSLAVGLLAGSVLPPPTARGSCGAPSPASRACRTPGAPRRRAPLLTGPIWLCAALGLAMGLGVPARRCALGELRRAPTPMTPATTSRSGTASACRCCSPRSPSGAACCCTAHGTGWPGCTTAARWTPSTATTARSRGRTARRQRHRPPAGRVAARLPRHDPRRVRAAPRLRDRAGRGVAGRTSRSSVR